MPEGDTIFRTAAVLRAVLVGRTVIGARGRARPGMRRVPDLNRLVGTAVTDVESRGKHLLIGFDSGLTLRTHMRMSGSWHRYRPGETWRLPKFQPSVVLETADSVAVCFNAPTVELLTGRELARHSTLAALGPDLLAHDFDADSALERLRERNSVELGEALLDQRALAGIGNVYKSEVCFIERLSPWRPIAELDDATLARVLASARRLLRANIGGGARVTTGGTRVAGRLWVYGRSGRRCRRCGTRIEARRQGELPRTTYWCPS
ncbi:MAG: Fpg/Nei family DNA glycosylase, partial [Chloroflexota bacterium]|nr:Fpg/Nei family DNA glycosylase [Chloroflexota bacterium]